MHARQEPFLCRRRQESSVQKVMRVDRNLQVKFLHTKMAFEKRTMGNSRWAASKRVPRLSCL